MNEQLQNALEKFILKITSGMEQATEFVVGELPDVIQQTLDWYFTVNMIYFVLSVSVLVGVSKFFVQTLSKIYKEHPDFMKINYAGDKELNEKGFGMLFGSFILLVVGAMVAATFINLEWLQIWIAPKLWLIEYASDLVK